MKKLFATAVMAAMTFAVVPSHAQIAQPTAKSCVVTPDYAADEVCSFTSTGLVVQIVTLTPNPWSVTAYYKDANGNEVVRAQQSSGDLNPGGQGASSIHPQAGDRVEVIEYQDGVDPIVGEGGFVVAGEVN
jgi:hypothetical protein